MLAYEIEGRGPGLLMIHGFGISYNIWRELRPLLWEYFTLIMVALPGIDGSPAPVPGGDYLDAAAKALLQVRESLGIDSWRVLSYSSGTRAAERYLALDGEHVAMAAFLCPVRTSVSAARALQAAIYCDRKFPQIGNWVLSGWRFLFLLNLFGFNLKGGPNLKAWYEEITSQPVDILKETLGSIPDGGQTEFRIPAGLRHLFVWGSEDLITASPRLALGNNRLIHANHSAPQTAAREVAEIIIPFFRDGGVSE